MTGWPHGAKAGVLARLLNLVLVVTLVGAVVGGCASARWSAEELRPAGSLDIGGPSDAASSDDAPSDAALLRAALHGLDFDRFLEVSFRGLALRDPETIIAFALSDTMGLSETTLTDISEAYVTDTFRMHEVALEGLLAFDRETLIGEQKVSYDVYRWYLEDTLAGEEFRYCDYPATFWPITAVHQQTLLFFELYPLNGPEDARDYVLCLWQVKAKFDQLIDGLRRREELGVNPPRFAVQAALGLVRRLAGEEPASSPYYRILARRLGQIWGLSPADGRALLAAAEDAVVESVQPAYQALGAYLEHQLEVAPTDDGLWQFPQGEAYYEHLLRHYTTTELSADEIHDLGLSELERIHGEMRLVSEELGYPADLSLPDVFDRVAEEGGVVPAGRVRATYQEILERAQANLGEAFSRLPKAEVVVIASGMSGVYQSPAADGSRPGMFLAGPDNQPAERYAMPTLTYHETVPGHHLQIALAMEADLPMFRRLITFLGYVEGWALYAERLAYELGWYADDPYGYLGLLQAEAFRAARLVVDTGIHTRGWTMSEATEFFTANTGLEPGDSIDPREQVQRYIVWPGQATAYYVGMLKLRELRGRAEAVLGDSFDLKGFHSVVLDNGSMPLEVLERVVEDYIAGARGAAGP